MTRFKKQPIPKDLRLAVFERDGYICRYCGKYTERPHADHVYPESRGGATIIENLVTACRDCNMKKQAFIGIWPMTLSETKETNYRISDLEKEIKLLRKEYSLMVENRGEENKITETKYQSMLSDKQAEIDRKQFEYSEFINAHNQRLEKTENHYLFQMLALSFIAFIFAVGFFILYTGM